MSTAQDYWTASAERLRAGYAEYVFGGGAASAARFHVVTRALEQHLAPRSHIVDIGCGFGVQAVLLAKRGHTVTAMDHDEVMVREARRMLAEQPSEIGERIHVVLGRGEDVLALLEGSHDAVLCHSVLMYTDDVAAVLRNAVSLLRPRGLLSVLTLNPGASAMRSGLQGRWSEAVQSLKAGRQLGPQYVPTCAPEIGTITSCLAELGLNELARYGVGVFSDHLV